MWQKIVSIGFIFLCSYWRHTYYFDLLGTDSVLIKVGNEVGNAVKFQSVTIYFIFFGMANAWIALVYKKEYLKLWVVIYVVLFAVATIFIGLHYASKLSGLFSLGTIIKNFLLSPIFPLVLFVILFKMEQQKPNS